MDFSVAVLLRLIDDGDLDLVNSLLNKCSINKSRTTVVHKAAARGHREIVRLLIQKDFPLDEQDEDGNTPLHVALSNKHPEIANLLWRKSNLNTRNNRKETPLFCAILHDLNQLAEIFIKNGSDVDAKDVYGMTPLHLAAQRGNSELAEILLRYGADVNTKDDNEAEALYYATRKKDIKLVEILLEFGAATNTPQRYHISPTLAAVQENHIQLVEILLKHGAKELKQHERKFPLITLLHSAAKKGNLEIVKLLMMKGIDKIHVSNLKHETPLLLAVKWGHLEVLKYLIENGSKIIPVNHSDDSISMPVDEKKKSKSEDYFAVPPISSKDLLENAIRNVKLEVWKYLLTCVSKIDVNTDSSELHLAVREGRVEKVQEIVKESNKNEAKSLYGRLAVFIAVENGNEEILKILLKAGYSIKSCFEHITPLHIAATFHHSRLVEMLLNAGADVNSKTHMDETPLHFAAAAGHSNVVKFLLQAGAEPSINAEYGSPLTYALKRGPINATVWIVTPSLFQNLLEITKMVIVGANEYEYFEGLLDAMKITVSKNNEEEKPNEEDANDSEESNNESRSEIMICFFNYMKNYKIAGILDSVMLRFSKRLDTQDFLGLIVEYNYLKPQLIKRIDFQEDYKSNLLIINQMNAESLIDFFNRHKCEMNNTREVFRLLVARLVFLNAINTNLKRKLLQIYILNNVVSWLKEFHGQLKSMRETEVDNVFSLTVYDILTEPISKIANYTRKKRLLEKLESSYEKFPAYVDVLKLNVELGKKRRDLSNLCVNSMCHFIEKNHKIHIAYFAIEQIFLHLSVGDMHSLLEAFS